MPCTVKETTKSRGDSSRGLSERSAKKTYLVQYDATTPPASLVAVETAEGSNGTNIPVLRSLLAADPLRIVKKISVKPSGSGDGLLYEVEVTCERFSPGEENPNPLLRPDTVSFDGSSEKTPFFLTEETPSRPVVTSAGEPFEELQDRDTGIFKLVIEGNRASINPALYASYLYPATAVNLGSVTVRGLVIGAGEGRVTAISATPQNEEGIEFLRVRWEVAVAPTWDLSIEDRGFYERDAATGKLKEIAKGIPPTKPDHGFPLDGAGVAMTSPSDVPATLTFPRYPKKDFGVFGWTV